MADKIIDQAVMDQLIIACIGPATISTITSPNSIAERACQIAEAVYAERQRCIEARAKAEGDKRDLDAKRVRRDKPAVTNMTGGMP